MRPFTRLPLNPEPANYSRSSKLHVAHRSTDPAVGSSVQAVHNAITVLETTEPDLAAELVLPDFDRVDDGLNETWVY
jgi:hypothetical protein